MNGLNTRPHPGPLPQERESYSPRSGYANALDCRAAFSAKDTTAVTSKGTSGLARDMCGCSLSPGERVRVRASVNLTSDSTF
jgi:hypothetical protein